MQLSHEQPATIRRQSSAKHWLLIFIDHGDITCRFRGIELNLKAGQALIIPAGTPYRETINRPTRQARSPLLLTNDHSLSRKLLDAIYCYDLHKINH